MFEIACKNIGYAEKLKIDGSRLIICDPQMHLFYDQTALLNCRKSYDALEIIEPFFTLLDIENMTRDIAVFSLPIQQGFRGLHKESVLFNI